MTKHIFFTGVRGVGKSTLLQKRLAQYQGIRAGFITKKTPCGDTFAVHMLPVGVNAAPSEKNLLFCCDNKRAFAQNSERFDRIGCEILRDIDGAAVIVMDELGAAESCAATFQKRVFELLEGDIPILGVLQEGESEFLQKVALHPNVELIRVTQENRDRLL